MSNLQLCCILFLWQIVECELGRTHLTFSSPATFMKLDLFENYFFDHFYQHKELRPLRNNERKNCFDNLQINLNFISLYQTQFDSKTLSLVSRILNTLERENFSQFFDKKSKFLSSFVGFSFSGPSKRNWKAVGLNLTPKCDNNHSAHHWNTILERC